MAMHNVSSGDNTREEIVQGIEDFRRVFGEYPAINVHHEKSRENLYFHFAQSGNHLPPTFRTTAFRRMQKLISQNGAAPRDCACSGEDIGSIHFWGDICRADPLRAQQCVLRPSGYASMQSEYALHMAGYALR